MSESKQPQLLEPHSLSLLFPPMSDAAFEDFVADIKANGLTSPIVVFEDKVLEGVHRQRACLQAGVEPRYTPYQGNNPLGFVLSANLHRRHLDASQRAMIADKLATMKQGRPGKDAPVHVSRNAAATALNVSKRSVADAAVVRKLGAPELVEAVETGAMAVKPAANLARKPAETQREAMKDLPRDAKGKPTVPKPRKPPTGKRAPAGPLQIEPTRPLTPQEVDPEFEVRTGEKYGSIRWVDEYGLVQGQTAQQRATSRFHAWASNMQATVLAMRKLPEWSAVDHNWLRQPNPHDICKLTEALEYLRPKLAEAEGLLERAIAANAPIPSSHKH